MATWGATLNGLSSVLALLDDIEVRFADDTVYLVGSGVEYAVYVEQGTSKMAAQPYLFPAAREVARELPRIAQSADSLDSVLKQAALEIEGRAKRRCPVDTGTLRDSIRAEKVR